MLSFFLLAMLYGSIFVIHEGEQGILLRLGEIVTDSKGQALIFNPGLHFKLPVINKVVLFDVRLRTLNVDSSRILTQEQKYVMVDYFAKWRIENPALYLQRTTGNSEAAERLLTGQINDGLRAEFGKRTIKEVIAGERSNIMASIRDMTNKVAQKLGIQIIDFRIKRIDLPAAVSASVFERMRADREKVASMFRAEGQSDAERIRADADLQATVIRAQAKRQAAETKAQGEAQASEIYTTSYQKDPSFYSFLRSIDSYQHTFSSKQDFILLKPGSQYFRYFNSTGKTE